MSLAHLSVFAAQSRSSDLSNPKLPRLTVSSYSTVYILWYLVLTKMIILVLVIVVSVHPQGVNAEIEIKQLSRLALNEGWPLIDSMVKL